MKTSELLFVGIKGFALALNRATGEQVWATALKGMDFVNLFVEEGRIFATCRGEAFCLEAATGRLLWHNRLKGYGTSLATMATEASGRSGMTPAMAEKRRRDEEAAAAAAVAAA